MNITFDVKHGAVKRALALVGGIAVIGGVVAAAQAVPNMFQNGEVLTAAQLNANFANLEQRVGSLENSKVVLESGTIGGGLSQGSWTLEEAGDNYVDIGVTFNSAFATVPEVIVLIKDIDAGTESAHMMLGTVVLSKSKTGCTIRLADYSDSSIWAANVTWIAYTN